MRSKATLNFSQQQKLLDPKAPKPVTLIGAGAVGSLVAYALAKMGVPKLDVWDDDDVSEHNIPMSLYRQKDFMTPKVVALRKIIKESSGLTIGIEQAKYAGQRPLSGVIIACVDTMEARQEIWKCVRKNQDVDLLIETRTVKKLLKVFAVDPNDPDDVPFYDYYVSYGSREAEQQMCGTHGFMPMSLHAATKVAENLTTWWMSGIKELFYEEHVALPAVTHKEES